MIGFLLGVLMLVGALALLGLALVFVHRCVRELVDDVREHGWFG